MLIISNQCYLGYHTQSESKLDVTISPGLRWPQLILHLHQSACLFPGNVSFVSYESSTDHLFHFSHFADVDALLTMVVQEIVILMSDNNTGSQQPKRKRQAGKKGPAQLTLKPCWRCID